jgi:hypothetical protein
MRIFARDSGVNGTDDVYFSVGPSTTYYYAGGIWLDPGVGNDKIVIEAGQVVVCSNGDLYYRCGASGSGTLDVWLEVWGYWI